MVRDGKSRARGSNSKGVELRSVCCLDGCQPFAATYHPLDIVDAVIRKCYLLCSPP